MSEEKALRAKYSSPSGKEVSSSGKEEFAHQLSIKCPPNASTAEKTAYLSELRASTKKLQENINTFLTQKMEEDKTREAREKGAKAKTRDEIEEDQYGEEAVEDD